MLMCMCVCICVRPSVRARDLSCLPRASSPGAAFTLDTSKYTVIVVNMLGNGVSYSPSLITDSSRSLEGPPPLFTVADNVRAQRDMLINLGIFQQLTLVYGKPTPPVLPSSSSSRPCRHSLYRGCLVLGPCPRAMCTSFLVTLLTSQLPLCLPPLVAPGYSMGGLQAYEWAVAFPEAVKRIAVVCGAARCGEVNKVFLGSLEAALKVDPAWEEKHTGFFDRRPERGLLAFGHIYAGWGVGTEWYNEKRYLSAGYSSAEDFVKRSYVPGFAHCDADDLVSQIRTWKAADVSAAHGRDLKAALARVKAHVLLMPCDSDRYFTLAEARQEAEVRTPKSRLGSRGLCIAPCPPRGATATTPPPLRRADIARPLLLPAQMLERVTLAPVESPAGHRAGDPHRKELKKEANFLRENVHKLLGTSVHA
jgi:pimeloyl-ACP methyl ester carboxylesterase